MAEGLLRHLAGDRFAVYSAGIEATFVRPHAKKVMSEVGIDISGQEPNTLEGCLGQPFDHVITVCDAANEACPYFPYARQRLHRSLPDPAAAEGTEEERLEVFRLVRDRLRDHIEEELRERERAGSLSIRPFLCPLNFR
jgi:arsenate reductase (thioredoxin)